MIACYDNATCESFLTTLERELLNRTRFRNQAQARFAVFDYIEGWYNLHRSHSGIGYLSPTEFERRHYSLPTVENPYLSTSVR